MKISELTVGEIYEITLAVKSATAKETKAKKPYLSIEFFDGIESITGNYWDWTSGNVPANNSILDVVAQVTEWMGVKQLNVKGMKNNTTRHIAEFAPATTVDIADVYKDAYCLANSVNDADLREIALSALDELRDKWLTVPGAVGVHHAYVGGTLIHSVSVAKIAAAIADNVSIANKDLCIVGGLLHDIGKLYTYRLNGISIDMTDQGKLYDHIFIGAEFIGNFAEEHLNCDDYATIKKIELLRHIILSHHGQLEYGSPVVPQCIEAHIVNHADSVDATAEQIRAAAAKVPNNIKWTERLYTMNNKSQLTPAYVDYIMTEAEEETVSN